ncbi:RNase H domain-containing protein [Trichonephila clavipes]|nr:RNase H domain-containing protein [Trichonephila clavipes]
MLIRNVPNDVDNSELRDVIREQNPEILVSNECWNESRVRFVLKKFQHVRTVVIEFHPKIWKNVNAVGSLKIMWNMCRIENFLVKNRLIRRTQRRFSLRVIKGYKTISYVCYVPEIAVFAILGIPPIDLVILNNLDVRENYFSTSLDTLDGTIPVPLLPHPSCRKPISLVTYTNNVFQEYKTVCFTHTDGSTLNGRVGLACVIYEEGVENFTFQHRFRDECSVLQAELLCINLVVKLIQDSLHQGGMLNFLICTDSFSSFHCMFSVNCTEKLVVEDQSILYYLDCDIHFSYVRGHSGNLGNDRADQLAKEATCQDMIL